ncbi:YXWGXW repeat-containing protein [Pandoraea apista]|uniref:Lipoprotein n=1 Tax=Pandoraea apista TaxID=93218 RepID=A0A0B5FJY1_9BURK|nr:YXWGXW repeat-containing protein [Pandoraea apista]AJF00368.1 lipoprotein [Pandoraea apista]AKH74542.1 lipoprotein [Pandoraea apista]AKI63092.1 lipoprotein [Pandoraea apista]ALS64770.1 hypothetical protein AT395_07050 [Pandoraea apista]AVF41352.1 hypothetical protein AL486_17875 [Pandoraea apista]
MTKQSVRAWLTAAALTLASGIAVAETIIIAPHEPPAARVEVVPAPRAGYVWDPGHWRWAPGGYVWEPGHWQAVRAGHHWIPGHWIRFGANWRWIPGHWD